MQSSRLHNKTGERGRAMAWVALVVWLSGMTAWAFWMNRYTNTPGPAGTVPANCPGESTMELSQTNFTLVMFAHPRCPCTRASLRELESLMAQAEGRISAQVIFLRS